MNPATIELQKNIRESKDALQALADELRVKVHLAGLDAKDEWRKLEPQVAAMQAAAHDASEATHKAVNQMIREIEKLLAAIG